MSKARPKVILHIGQHKTGSKALQSFMAWHSRALERRGFLYPVKDASPQKIRAYSISHYRFFALLRMEAMEACGDTESAARFRAEQRAFCHPHGSLRDMLESRVLRRSRNRGETLVLSAEDLFDMHSAHETDFSMALLESGVKILARLFDEFGYDPTVIVYLRRQDHLLGAHYVQYIKGSACNHLDFTDFEKIFSPRLRTGDILAHWIAAFGAGKIKARAYEASFVPLNIVNDFFEQVFGFTTPPDWAVPPRDPESVNATPGRDYVEFIRILNCRNIQGLPVFRREDVLQAALAECTGKGSGGGIGAWLSPTARRALLERHAEGNAEIANRFAGGAGKPFFAEPLPGEDEGWSEYQGLSAERAIAIALEIRRVANGG